jgi:hypothetical protein
MSVSLAANKGPWLLEYLDPRTPDLFYTKIRELYLGINQILLTNKSYQIRFSLYFQTPLLAFELPRKLTDSILELNADTLSPELRVLNPLHPMLCMTANIN